MPPFLQKNSNSKKKNWYYIKKMLETILLCAFKSVINKMCKKSYIFNRYV